MLPLLTVCTCIAVGVLHIPTYVINGNLSVDGDILAAMYVTKF